MDFIIKGAALAKITTPTGAETELIKAEPFTEITPSWNAVTGEGIALELFIRLSVDGQLTPYISYGPWSRCGDKRGVANYFENEQVRQTSDRIFVKDGKRADAVQIKVAFTGNVRLNMLAFSTDGGTEHALCDGWLKTIEVPQLSQLLSGHEHARRICSPTTVAMLLKHLDPTFDYMETVAGVLDNGNGAYGNWPQNMAYVGEVGKSGYTKRCLGINDVKSFISQGIPVGASICAQEKMTGAIMAYPYGHLIVICGFAVRDGVEYIVVNDPAADRKDDIRRQYPLDEFISVWRKYIYVVRNM